MKIAVIGGGINGIMSAWALAEAKTLDGVLALCLSPWDAQAGPWASMAIMKW